MDAGNEARELSGDHLAASTSSEVPDSVGSAGVSSNADRISLTLPAVAQYVGVARITASGLASRLGFSWEEVEDLRLAVDELYHAILGPPDIASVVELSYLVHEDSLEIEAQLRHLNGTVPSATPELSEWAGYILAALVDSHGSRKASGTTSLWVRKSRVSKA